MLLSTPLTALELKREGLTRCTEHTLTRPVNGNKDDREGARLFRVSQKQEEQAPVGYRPGGRPSLIARLSLWSLKEALSDLQ